MMYLAIFIFWLLHFLPLPLLALIGQGLGLLFYALGRERRTVARINLGLCFPELSASARERLLRRHPRLVTDPRRARQPSAHSRMRSEVADEAAGAESSLL